MACPDATAIFYALAPRTSHTRRTARRAATQIPVTFVAFDLLHLDGEDLTGWPLMERKRRLDDLILLGPAWVTNSWYPGDDALFEACVQQGHEGVMAKRLGSDYLPGVRARTWLKKKSPEWKRDHAPSRRPREWNVH